MVYVRFVPKTVSRSILSLIYDRSIILLLTEVRLDYTVRSYSGARARLENCNWTLECNIKLMLNAYY